VENKPIPHDFLVVLASDSQVSLDSVRSCFRNVNGTSIHILKDLAAFHRGILSSVFA